jgi:hypothetical protein
MFYPIQFSIYPLELLPINVCFLYSRLQDASRSAATGRDANNKQDFEQMRVLFLVAFVFAVSFIAGVA